MQHTKTLAFTGLRPFKLPFGQDEKSAELSTMINTIKNLLIELIEDEQVSHFLSGMAEGSDQLCAEIVIELMENYPRITLEAAIPFPGQSDAWSVSAKGIYHQILQKCDKKTITSSFYSRGAYHNRNRYLVDSSDMVLAIWDGKAGGTAYTIEYAKNHGKTLFILDPNFYSVIIRGN